MSLLINTVKNDRDLNGKKTENATVKNLLNG